MPELITGKPLGHIPDYRSSRDYHETSVSWGGVQEEGDSHASRRGRELSGLEEEMAGVREPNQSSSVSTGSGLSKKQKQKLRRDE